MSKDTLFLALTRPAMRWGVPAEGFLANILFTFAAGAFLGRGNPAYWLMFVPIHYVMRALASTDHNFFRVRRLQMDTKWRSIGDSYGSRTSSLAALPSWPARNAKETIGSV